MPPEHPRPEGGDRDRGKRVRQETKDELDAIKSRVLHDIEGLDEDGATARLEALGERWQLDQQGVTHELLVTRAYENFGCAIRDTLDAADQGSFGLRALDLRVREHEMEAMALYSHMRTLDLLDETQDAGRARLELIVRVLEKVFHARRIVTATHMSALATEQAHFAGLVLDEDVDDMLGAWRMRFRWMDLSKNKPYQNALLYVLDCAMERQYRRLGDSCYEPILLEGRDTNAWRRVCEIRDFVYDCCRKEVSWEQWYNTTVNPSNMSSLVQHMQHCHDYQFPVLERDRSVFAFRNGVYAAREDRFYALGELPNSVVACRFLDADLDFHAHLRATPAGDSGGWRAIPTPFMQSILDYQGIPPEACDWLYVLMGRLLYNVGDQDGWQVIPFVKGAAGTGKSTLVLGVAKKFYETADVGVLSNNIEKKFGISALADKFLFLAPEIKADFNLEQAEFQSMVSGEDIMVATKHKTAHSVVWQPAGMLAGNETPNWVDNHSSIQRRVVVFQFTRPVPDGDMKLSDKLELELPRILLKCNRAYLETAARHGTRNIWKVLPDYFMRTRDQMAQATNSVEAFLVDQDRVRLGEALFCPFKAFKHALREFEVANQYKSNKTLTTDYMAGPFQKFGVRTVRDSRAYRGARAVTVEWVVGADLVDGPGGGGGELDG